MSTFCNPFCNPFSYTCILNKKGVIRGIDLRDVSRFECPRFRILAQYLFCTSGVENFNCMRK
jgi:hypothetical protein